MATILYLHGFLSSPQSPKAIQTIDYMRLYHPTTTLLVPQLPDDLSAAIRLISTLVQQHGACHFIGASLGGFLAAWAVEEFGGRAVLINPVVNPEKIKSQFIGWHVNTYTQENFYVDDLAFSRLQSLEAKQLSTERYWVLLQTADEVLDYRLAVNRYQHCLVNVEEGGDHTFVDYHLWLPRIMQFLTTGIPV